mmetsp:Transcript_95462/g.275021  ORF Transcript_95462/g.275021 Transcript_95462/m.275021 type:complete len:202 (-) Transcript_95462:301-906(-)
MSYRHISRPVLALSTATNRSSSTETRSPSGKKAARVALKGYFQRRPSCRVVLRMTVKPVLQDRSTQSPSGDTPAIESPSRRRNDTNGFSNGACHTDVLEVVSTNKQFSERKVTLRVAHVVGRVRRCRAGEGFVRRRPETSPSKDTVSSHNSSPRPNGSKASRYRIGKKSKTSPLRPSGRSSRAGSPRQPRGRSLCNPSSLA